jgi:hypothetical protein
MVIGRKIQPNYIAALNARSPMVYQQQAAADERAHQSRMEKLQKKSDAFERASTREQLELQEEALKDARRRGLIGAGVSLGGLAAQTYFSTKGANETKALADEISRNTQDIDRSGSSMPSQPHGGGQPAGGGIFRPESGGAGSGGSSFLTGLKDNAGSILIGGGAGLAASMLGKKPLEKAAIGAGTGALTGWLASGGARKLISGEGGGGSILASAASALVGGLGGLFS